MVVWPRSGSESLEPGSTKRCYASQRKEILLDNFNIRLHRYISHRLGGNQDELLADRASGGDNLDKIINLRSI